MKKIIIFYFFCNSKIQELSKWIISKFNLSCLKLKTIPTACECLGRLTGYTGLGVEHGLAFSQSHGPAHLSCVVFWHVNHLKISVYNISIRHMKIVDITMGYRCSLSTNDFFLQQKLNTV